MYADVAYYYSWIEGKISADLSDNSTSDAGSSLNEYSSNGNVWTPIRIITILLSLLLSVIQSVL